MGLCFPGDGADDLIVVCRDVCERAGGVDVARGTALWCWRVLCCLVAPRFDDGGPQHDRKDTEVRGLRHPLRRLHINDKRGAFCWVALCVYVLWMSVVVIRVRPKKANGSRLEAVASRKEFVNRAWRVFRPPRGRVLRLPLATSTWRVGGHGQWAVLYVRRLEEDELLLCGVWRA